MEAQGNQRDPKDLPMGAQGHPKASQREPKAATGLYRALSKVFVSVLAVPVFLFFICHVSAASLFRKEWRDCISRWADSTITFDELYFFFSVPFAFIDMDFTWFHMIWIDSVWVYIDFVWIDIGLYDLLCTYMCFFLYLWARCGLQACRRRFFSGKNSVTWFWDYVNSGNCQICQNHVKSNENHTKSNEII